MRAASMGVRMVPGGLRLEFENDEHRESFDQSTRDLALLREDADRLDRLATLQRRRLWERV
jgi:hypothetical protein